MNYCGMRGVNEAQMIVIGFGEFKNYKLQEIPDLLLTELAKSYGLSHTSHDNSDKVTLRATIAVHEEVQRRANGGAIWTRPVSRREIATKLVNLGFRHLSKAHHPDKAGGDLETQKVLAEMRDYLLTACNKILEPGHPGAFVIPDPHPYAHSTEITDDDIPF